MFPLSTYGDIMSADFVFSLANPFALVGWLILIFAIWRKNSWLRDSIAGFWWPLALSSLYFALILLFFGKSDGGFDTLANVKKLFISDWAALAGWVHYLAFDLFIGSWIARQVMSAGMNRLWLIPLLPATFLFGPIGLVGYGLASRLAAPVDFKEV
jgi:Domain of unknown function (DUF4281)